MRLAALTLMATLGCSAAGSEPTRDAAPDAFDAAAANGDAAASDGAAAVDAARSRYWQWEYPQCRTSTGICPAGCDSRSSVIVAPDKCGPFVEAQTNACFPNTVLLSGWSCLRRSADGEVISYYYPPYTTEGLEPCPANERYPIGSPPQLGQHLCPADGGAD